MSSRFAIAQVSGPASEYLINTVNNKALVTIVNTVGTTWNGTVSYNAASGNVKEYIGDTA